MLNTKPSTELAEKAEASPSLAGLFLKSSFATCVAISVVIGNGTPVLAQSDIKHESELIFAAAGGSTRNAFEAALGNWAKKENVKITWIEQNSAASYSRTRAEANRKVGTVDLIVLNDPLINLARHQDLLALLDPKLVTNEKEVLTEYAFPEDAYGNPPAGVRFDINAFGLIYNTDTFKKNGWEKPDSWYDLYNPKYASCVVPVAPTDGTMYLAVLNKLNAGDFLKFDMTLQNFKKIAKQVPSFVNTTAQAIDMLQRGIGCISVAYQGRAYDAMDQGAPIDYVTPKEGIGWGGGTFAVNKNAPHPIVAQLALNQLISADGQQAIYEKTYFTPVNPKVKKATSGLLTKVLMADEFARSTNIYPPLSVAEHIDEWTRAWSEMASSK